MRKQEFASRLAKSTGVSPAKAADELDGVVHDVLRKLRAGKAVRMPGLGTIVPGEKPRLEPEDKRTRKGGRREQS